MKGMSELMAFGNILTEFGRSSGLEKLRLNDDAYCQLRINDNLRIDIRYHDNNETFSLLSEIGKLGENNFEICCNFLLKSNGEWELSNGMTLGKIPETKMVTLGYYEPVQGLTKERFAEILKQFVDTGELWAKRIVLLAQGEIPEELADL
jgi:hypothetical protein